MAEKLVFRFTIDALHPDEVGTLTAAAARLGFDMQIEQGQFGNSITFQCPEPWGAGEATVRINALRSLYFNQDIKIDDQVTNALAKLRPATQE